MGARIEAKDVSKRFGSHVVLRDVTLEIASGELFGLIGPNGAGKTTFLRILTGYWLPTSGDVHVDGISVVKQRATAQEAMGYACEQPKLYMDHLVDTFLRFMGALRGLGGAELRNAVDTAIERFGLREMARRRIGVLSKGFRQRVSLAQAMLHEPPLLVIDEPTVGLDPRQQIDLRAIIQELRGSHTVLVCTHQLSEAEAICDRVALLDRGRLVRIASANEIRAGASLESLFLEATRADGAES